jgi:hypothetical protein
MTQVEVRSLGMTCEALVTKCQTETVMRSRSSWIGLISIARGFASSVSRAGQPPFTGICPGYGIADPLVPISNTNICNAVSNLPRDLKSTRYQPPHSVNQMSCSK